VENPWHLFTRRSVQNVGMLSLKPADLGGPDDYLVLDEVRRTIGCIMCAGRSRFLCCEK